MASRLEPIAPTSAPIPIAPAIVIAGTHSGCGKTTVALALLAALTRRGVRAQPFKVGPDFIDPLWQSRATGRTSRNLDTWLLEPDMLAWTYLRATEDAGVALIEGVMGLFDGRSGLDEAGSTADLARLWDVPVVLTVDARGLSRSAAALVRGFTTFDPSVDLAGVIANKVGSSRHFTHYLKPALGERADMPRPLGYLARDDALSIPSRHLGLTTDSTFHRDGPLWHALADAAEATIDIDAILAVARPPKLVAPRQFDVLASELKPTMRVGVARDAAFLFYYEDNLDLLRAAGAEVVAFSTLDDAAIPDDVDLIYLGGGYPELHAPRLAANVSMRDSIRSYHARGGRVYAECGGMMACCSELVDGFGRSYPMWGLIPARTVLGPRRAALGYATIEATADTWFADAGTRIRGHEFHYSRLEAEGPLTRVTSLLRADNPTKPDAVAVGGLVAGYAHAHFGSNPNAIRWPAPQR